MKKWWQSVIDAIAKAFGKKKDVVVAPSIPTPQVPEPKVEEPTIVTPVPLVTVDVPAPKPAPTVIVNDPEIIKVLFARLNQSLIYPPFLVLAKKLILECYNQGVWYYATSGMRTWEEQQKLYNQGRTAESKAKGEKIVTNAKPGSSYHNYGLAIDFCKDSDIKKQGLS